MQNVAAFCMHHLRAGALHWIVPSIVNQAHMQVIRWERSWIFLHYPKSMQLAQLFLASMRAEIFCTVHPAKFPKPFLCLYYPTPTGDVLRPSHWITVISTYSMPHRVLCGCSLEKTAHSQTHPIFISAIRSPMESITPSIWLSVATIFICFTQMDICPRVHLAALRKPRPAA